MNELCYANNPKSLFRKCAIDNKSWFLQNQQVLLNLLKQNNQNYLKHQFNIKHGFPLVKVTPNSLHFWTGEMQKDLPIITAKFFMYEAVAKYLLPVFAKAEIAAQEYLEQIKRNPYKTLLHFAGLQQQKYLPKVYLAQSNFYAGAGDGHVKYVGSGGETLATVHDAATGTANDPTSTTMKMESTRTDATPNFTLSRVFIPTDISSIGSGGTISAILLYFWPTAKTDGDNGGIGVSQATQASNTTLANADYDACDVGHPATRGASDIDVGTGITTGQYNYFTINATGRGWADVTGWAKYALRADGDLDGNHNETYLTGTNDVTMYASEQTGTANDPYLDITYTPGAGNIFAGINF